MVRVFFVSKGSGFGLQSACCMSRLACSSFDQSDGPVPEGLVTEHRLQHVARMLRDRIDDVQIAR